MLIELSKEEIKRLIEYTGFAISEDTGDNTVVEDYDLIEKLESYIDK